MCLYPRTAELLVARDTRCHVACGYISDDKQNVNPFSDKTEIQHGNSFGNLRFVYLWRHS